MRHAGRKRDEAIKLSAFIDNAQHGADALNSAGTCRSDGRLRARFSFARRIACARDRECTLRRNCLGCRYRRPRPSADDAHASSIPRAHSNVHDDGRKQTETHSVCFTADRPHRARGRRTVQNWTVGLRLATGEGRDGTAEIGAEKAKADRGSMPTSRCI
jgi:hypothetical protein